MFAEAERSIEVDVVPLDDPDGRKADLVDGSIGEASMFHEAFGIYAQGVVETTAILPDGWRERLVRYDEPASGMVAWCLDLHDLWVSKPSPGGPRIESSALRCAGRAFWTRPTSDAGSRWSIGRPTPNANVPPRGSSDRRAHEPR